MLLRADVGRPLSPGLRYVVVFTYLQGAMPPAVGSAGDRALLEAANLALRRKVEGKSDAFLFVLWGGSDDLDLDVAAIRAYGFPDALIRIVGEELQSPASRLLLENGEVVPEDMGEEVAHEIQCWLKKDHPAALPYPGGEYPLKTLWWLGIENAGVADAHAAIEWNFDSGALAELLPQHHSARARTWVGILGSIGSFDRGDGPEHFLTQQHGSVLAAVLTSWLHGFEAASGNGFYNFDPTWAVEQLGIDHLMLGHELAGVQSDGLEELCNEHGCELVDLPGLALRLIAEDRVSLLHRAMTDFFGGKVMLFCALYWSIWPKVEESMSEAMSHLTGDCSFDRC